MGGLSICNSSCAALVQGAMCFNKPGSEEEKGGDELLTFVLNDD